MVVVQAVVTVLAVVLVEAVVMVVEAVVTILAVIFGMQSPPPLCKYFTWIDHEVPEDVQKDQYQDCLRHQRRFEEIGRAHV